MSQTAHIRLDLDDVRHAGSVSDAIIAWCGGSDDTSAATPATLGGQTFATSGPGPGWSRQFGANDYAEAALRDGAAYVVDPGDGTIAKEVAWDEPGDDIAESRDAEIEWSDESCVELVAPSIEDAIDHPAAVAEMMQAVIGYHSAESNKEDWRKLLAAIREAASALEDIDEDSLAD